MEPLEGKLANASVKQFVPMAKVRAKLLISFVLEIKYSVKGKEEKRMNEFIWR